MGSVADVALAVASLVGLEVVEWGCAAWRHRAVIAVVRIVAVVDVAVETVRAVEPWAGTDEDATEEPVRAVVTVRSAVVRWIVEVAVRTDWRGTDIHPDCDLRAR